MSTRSGIDRSRSGSRGRTRSRARSLVSRITGRSDDQGEYIDPNDIHSPTAPPHQEVIVGENVASVDPPPNISSEGVDIGISDQVLEAFLRESAKTGTDPRTGFGSAGAAPPLPPNRESQDTMEAIKRLTDAVQVMSHDIKAVQLAQQVMKNSPQYVHQPISTMEEIPPPPFKTSGAPIVNNMRDPIHLQDTSLKKIRDLRTLLEYRYKPSKQNVTEWLRNFAKKVAIMASHIQPSVYNVLLMDNLDPASQEQLHSFLGGKCIQDWTPDALHKIVLTALGGGSTEIDRQKEFFSYHPKTDSVPPTTISKLIHRLYSLGAAANISQVQVYKKLLSVLPPVAKQELRSAISARRSFDPSYVPNTHELLELTADATESINQELMELYGKKKVIKAISAFEVEDEKEGKILGIGLTPPNPNSHDRQFYPRLDKPPPDTCTNCLQLGHKYTSCRFKINCVLCGGPHPAPVCHIYKNDTPVQKACYHCSLKGVLLHHASANCLLVKESQIEETKN